MLKKICFISCVVLLVAACKTTKIVTENTAVEELTAIEVIQKHYANEKKFETVNIRASAKYSDAKQTQNVSADIRIKRNEIIWINVKLLGFPVAKALLTPTKVSYYEKINNTFFDGNYELISTWLGTDLDFNKVQNIFIGEPTDNLTKQKYLTTIVDGMYKVTEKNKTTTEKEFYFEAANYLLKKETITQPLENRSLGLNYASYSNQNNSFFPNEVSIEAKQKNEVKIEIQYKSITFDENLNTSFSIPNGYEEIQIK
ncbi:DUF4292 domain-containing protein [Flavobacterium sp.]|uniref:DUF4292 domain-containing protein n=1 Tax=Flavobacterium sp. TaxID=239 RepID=UPI003526D08C